MVLVVERPVFYKCRFHVDLILAWIGAVTCDCFGTLCFICTWTFIVRERIWILTLSLTTIINHNIKKSHSLQCLQLFVPQVDLLLLLISVSAAIVEKVVQYLHERYRLTREDARAVNSYASEYACRNRHLHVVKYLCTEFHLQRRDFESGIDVAFNKDYTEITGFLNYHLIS